VAIFMVTIEDRTKSKEGEVQQLAKEVFGKSWNLSFTRPSVYGVYVVKNLFLDLLPGFDPTLILAIDTSFNEFRLYEGKYFDKAKELAKKYEEQFKAKVTLQIK
jgi:hypothetical protein